MNKYALLFLFNSPFILYGAGKSIIYFKEKQYSRRQLLVRLVFWIGCLGLLAFAKPIYDFLRGNRLTDSPPLSIADVLLTTLCFLSLTLVIRLYARLEKAEKQVTELNEYLALKKR